MKKFICILISILSVTVMFAQPQKGDRKQFSPEEFEKRLQCFITEKACLTPEEAAGFFPLLKDMYNEQRAISQKMRKLQMPGKELSEDDYKRLILDMTEMEVKQKQIEQTYYTKKFPKVLSWKKILFVRGALERFKMEALRVFTPHGGGGMGPGPRKK